MSDQKPPRFAAGEDETLVRQLQYQRESFLRNLDGLEELEANRHLVKSETTLFWLVVHLARAESIWFFERFAGVDSPVRVDDEVSLQNAIDQYRDVIEHVDDLLLRETDLSVRCADPDFADLSLRWVLVHLLEETARHAGHADILRELIDGTTGR